MLNTGRRVALGGVVAIALGAVLATVSLATVSVEAQAPTVKISDPTSVVMIVNRDSNEIAFMDIPTRKIVGRTFLGNNVNPHMVMMSPDGRYVVTGGTRIYPTPVKGRTSMAAFALITICSM